MRPIGLFFGLADRTRRPAGLEAGGTERAGDCWASSAGNRARGGCCWRSPSARWPRAEAASRWPRSSTSPSLIAALLAARSGARDGGLLLVVLGIVRDGEERVVPRSLPSPSAGLLERASSRSLAACSSSSALFDRLRRLAARREHRARRGLSLRVLLLLPRRLRRARPPSWPAAPSRRRPAEPSASP